MKKYKLTSEVLVMGSTVLTRIQAVEDFDDVKTGDLGGFIEDETSLSREGACWVYNDACVYCGGKVLDNAKIYDRVCVFDKAIVSKDSIVRGAQCVWGNVVIDKEVIGVESDSILKEELLYGEKNIPTSEDSKRIAYEILMQEVKGIDKGIKYQKSYKENKATRKGNRVYIESDWNFDNPVVKGEHKQLNVTLFVETSWDLEEKTDEGDMYTPSHTEQRFTLDSVDYIQLYINGEEKNIFNLKEFITKYPDRFFSDKF